MKKCIKCEIIFNSGDRTYCLYCDTILVTAVVDEVLSLQSEKSLLEQAIKSEGPVTHERMEYIVGSYFQSKSLGFRYSFCRSEFRMGKKSTRFFIQPLDFSFLIRLPWLVINVADSLFARLAYSGFCEKCNWKVVPGGHSEDECEYNKEYSLILSEIMNGKITKSEERFSAVTKEKVDRGKRSAYHDLCASKKSLEIFFDILVILLSIGLIVFILVKFSMPLLDRFFHFSDTEYS